MSKRRPGTGSAPDHKPLEGQKPPTFAESTQAGLLVPPLPNRVLGNNRDESHYWSGAFRDREVPSHNALEYRGWGGPASARWYDLDGGDSRTASMPPSANLVSKHMTHVELLQRSRNGGVEGGALHPDRVTGHNPSSSFSGTQHKAAPADLNTGASDYVARKQRGGTAPLRRGHVHGQG